MTSVTRALLVALALGCASTALSCSMKPLVYVGTKPSAPVAGNSAIGGAGTGTAGEDEEHDDHEDTADEHQDESDSSDNP